MSDFNRTFGVGWDQKKIDTIISNFPGVSRQPPQFLHPYKSSWYLTQASAETIATLEQQLSASGLNVSVIYSSSRDLDVLPRDASKGSALKWLCERLGTSLEKVLVAGDTANDKSMFLLPGIKGIVVENSQPELIESVVKLPTFNASQVMADGGLEGV